MRRIIATLLTLRSKLSLSSLDINGDGKVDMSDLLFVYRILLTMTDTVRLTLNQVGKDHLRVADEFGLPKGDTHES